MTTNGIYKSLLKFNANALKNAVQITPPVVIVILI